MAITVSDVENWSSTGWEQLSSGRKSALVNTAESIVDNQLSQKTATFSTVEGDTDEAKELLAAHLFELSEGGEASSDSTQGGNVTYNTVTGEWKHSLSETRYGRMLQDLYLRGRSGIGMVRTYPRR